LHFGITSDPEEEPKPKEIPSSELAEVRIAIERYLAMNLTNRCERSDREDLTQDIMAEIVRCWDKCSKPSSRKAWATGFAANFLKSFYKSKASERTSPIESQPESFFTDPSGDAAEKGLLDRAMAADLLTCFRAVCTPEEHLVVALRYQGKSTTDIAMRIQQKPATVPVHFMRARRKLFPYIILNRPDLIGGQEAINQAYAFLEANGLLEPQDVRAWKKKDRASEDFKGLSIRIVEHLATLLSLVLIMSILEGKPWI
jgi:RNA polymerase sigma factor (sigma-70 family)